VLLSPFHNNFAKGHSIYVVQVSQWVKWDIWEVPIVFINVHNINSDNIISVNKDTKNPPFVKRQHVLYCAYFI
jgi:hypothetical protein